MKGVSQSESLESARPDVTSLLVGWQHRTPGESILPGTTAPRSGENQGVAPSPRRRPVRRSGTDLGADGIQLEKVGEVERAAEEVDPVTVRRVREIVAVPGRIG